jgi:hypothetical protein
VGVVGSFMLDCDDDMGEFTIVVPVGFIIVVVVAVGLQNFRFVLLMVDLNRKVTKTKCPSL